MATVGEKRERHKHCRRTKKKKEKDIGVWKVGAWRPPGCRRVMRPVLVIIFLFFFFFFPNRTRYIQQVGSPRNEAPATVSSSFDGRRFKKNKRGERRRAHAARSMAGRCRPELSRPFSFLLSFTFEWTHQSVYDKIKRETCEQTVSFAWQQAGQNATFFICFFVQLISGASLLLRLIAILFSFTSAVLSATYARLLITTFLLLLYFIIQLLRSKLLFFSPSCPAV